MPFDIIIGRNEADRKKLGNKGVIFLGRSYVQMGRTVSLSNNLFMDVTRSHVVYVAGKRGCLIGDTFIYTDKGNKRIKEFNEQKDKVFSFNKDEKKFELENAKLLKYAVNEDLYIINLQDGQELVATSEHPFLVKSENGVEWKSASGLTTDDKIVSVLELPKKRYGGGISQELARLAGFILSDGTIFVQKGRFKDGRGKWYNGTKKRVRVINAQDEVLSCAKNDFEKEFGITAKRYKRDKYNCEVIETRHQKVINRLVTLGIPIGKKSKIIRVPKAIFSVSKNTIAQFLKALFSCDGAVGKGGRDIEYYSNSHEFLKDLQLLLRHFGIHSKVREKKTSCNGKKFLSYALSIWDYTSIKIFKEQIGIFGEEKRNRLKARKFWIMNRRKSTEYLSEELFFEKISSISKKKYKTEVYDLKVPKNHSFIANGIISHNSGKSYTLGVIAEGMSDLPPEIKNNVAVVMLDTMGIYWPMKQKNEKDTDLLAAWNLEPKALDIKIFTPFGFFKEYKDKGIPTDYPFSIKPTELNAEDWALTFGITTSDPVGVLIEKTLGDLKESGKSDYSIDDMIASIKKDDSFEQYTRNEAVNRLKTSQRWGLFNDEGTKIDALIKGGQVTVLDVSCYATGEGGWGVKNLVMGLISKKLFIERMISRKEEELEDINVGYSYFQVEAETKSELRKPLVWLIIDEAHECLPKVGKTAATDALVTILREGRQPGISLILATQQPGKIHDDVTTQADIVISHRITAKADIDALNSMTQSYLESTLTGYLNNLPSERGAALILDDNSERIYPMRVRPRFSWHGGEAPSALHIKKSMDLGL